VESVVADDGRCGVKAVNRAEVLSGGALVLDGLGVTCQRRGGSLSGAFEVGLGPFVLLFCDVEVVAEGAALAAWGGLELVGCCGVSSACVGGASFGVLECISVGGGRRRHVSCDGVGIEDSGVGPRPPRSALCLAGLGVEELAVGVSEHAREPVRDLAARCWCGRGGRGLSGGGGGEGAALGGGGDVGTVGSDDGLEHVARLGHVLALGDDAQGVDVAAAGRRNVEASATGDWRGEGEGGLDGVGLPTALGRRVAESDMVTDVVNGEGDVAVSAMVGHGYRAVRRHRPHEDRLLLSEDRVGCESWRGGSIQTERPSDWRTVAWWGESRSTSWLMTWSVARSRVAAQRRPDCCGTAVADHRSPGGRRPASSRSAAATPRPRHRRR
jgi:hypothetical protein